MSTQRRENRWRRIRCTGRGVLCRRSLPDAGQRAGVPGRDFPGPIVHHGYTSASGGTAPPDFWARFHSSDESLSPGGSVFLSSDVNLSPWVPAWLATNSPQSDYRLAPLVLLVRLVQLVQLVQFVQLQAVQIVRQDLSQGSPPFATELSRATGIPASHGSSLPHIPSPTGHARLLLTSPRVPAGKCRWAERYDGKRDMYLKHAA